MVRVDSEPVVPFWVGRSVNYLLTPAEISLVKHIGQDSRNV